MRNSWKKFGFHCAVWIPTASLLLLLALGSWINSATGATETLKPANNKLLTGIRPLTGVEVSGYGPLEKALLDYLDAVGAQAATVAISRSNQLIYSRGFGWSDQLRQKPVPPDALMRIASITKPITAAAIRIAIQSGRLSLQTKAFEFIGIKSSASQSVDERLYTITVGHLLDHKGGWDSSQSFDPMFRTSEIEKELKLPGSARPEDVITYMMTRPLQFPPGERSAYSNFGYCVLGRLLAHAMNKPYATCIKEMICRPLGITDLKLGRTDSRQRDPREVWYPVSDNAFSLEVMDAHGGLIASAPALCRFMDHYWLNGEPRQPGEKGNWTFFGSLPGTTSMARQRKDGLNVAVLLNARRNDRIKEDTRWLHELVDKALDDIYPGQAAAKP